MFVVNTKTRQVYQSFWIYHKFSENNFKKEFRYAKQRKS